MGSCEQALIRVSPNGATHPQGYPSDGRRTRGTETSKYPEERTSTETPLVVASERGPGQCLVLLNRKKLESFAVVGDSPVRVGKHEDLSKAGHEKSCLNMGGPPSKPKYS